MESAFSVCICLFPHYLKKHKASNQAKPKEACQTDSVLRQSWFNPSLLIFRLLKLQNQSVYLFIKAVLIFVHLNVLGKGKSSSQYTQPFLYLILKNTEHSVIFLISTQIIYYIFHLFFLTSSVLWKRELIRTVFEPNYYLTTNKLNHYNTCIFCFSSVNVHLASCFR